MRILFTHPEQFMGLFSLIIRRSSFRDHSYSAFSSRSPNLIGASFKCSLIISESLRSLVSKYSQVSSFVFQFYPVICAFATFIFNSYGGPFNNCFAMVIISIHSLVRYYWWCHQDLPKFVQYVSESPQVSSFVL